MKYIKKFKTDADYQTFKGSDDWIMPNVCSIVENEVVKYQEIILPPMYGDIVFWDGSKVDYVNKTKWKTKLGTPIGVVVVPEGFAPDGKARFIALNAVDASGNTSTSEISMVWSNTSGDTSLTNFTKVPTTDNTGSTSTGSSYGGYLPSDSFSGNQSFVDAKAKYQIDRTSNLIPSPYLTIDGKDTPNPEYYKEISDNNVLSDFSGLSNTETLVGLGSDYVAANAAWDYSDGLSNVQYYLPAMGELGYLLPRFNDINESLNLIGGVVVGSSSNFWSSSECSIGNAYCLRVNFSDVSNFGKYNNTMIVRPFGVI